MPAKQCFTARITTRSVGDATRHIMHHQIVGMARFATDSSARRAGTLVALCRAEMAARHWFITNGATNWNLSGSALKGSRNEDIPAFTRPPIPIGHATRIALSRVTKRLTSMPTTAQLLAANLPAHVTLIVHRLASRTALLFALMFPARFQPTAVLSTADPGITSLHDRLLRVLAHELLGLFGVFVTMNASARPSAATLLLDLHRALPTRSIMAWLVTKVLSTAQHSTAFFGARWQRVHTRFADHIGKGALTAGTTRQRLHFAGTARARSGVTNQSAAVMSA